MSEAPSVIATKSPRRRDWTQGSILRNLLLLSWPMIIVEAVYMSTQVLDMLWVGRSGTAALAAIGICSLVILMLSVIHIGIVGGSRALISRCMGAGDLEGARQAVVQAYLLALSWGLLVTVCGFFLSGHIMGLFGVQPDVAQQGARYLRIAFAGWLGLELHVMGMYTIQSTGDSTSPMIVQITARALHLLLSPLLVLGLFVFPTLGIAGAAIATVTAQTLGGLAGLWLLFGGYTRIKLSLKDIRFSLPMIRRMLKISIPALISMGQLNFGNIILARIVVPFGTLAVAAYNVAGSLQSFITTPNMGVGGAVSVLVGQNMGAQKMERAAKSVWLGAAILEGFLISCGVVVLVMANPIVAIFDSDPAVISLGADFFRIMTIAYLVLGLNTALGSCNSGAGDTLPNMIISLGMTWVIQIPLAYLLSHYTGLYVTGIRWAMIISPLFGCIAYLFYFRLGRWKHKKV
jgi:putative MATE family efflux protein